MEARSTIGDHQAKNPAWSSCLLRNSIWDCVNDTKAYPNILKLRDDGTHGMKLDVPRIHSDLEGNNLWFKLLDFALRETRAGMNERCGYRLQAQARNKVINWEHLSITNVSQIVGLIANCAAQSLNRGSAGPLSQLKVIMWTARKRCQAPIHVHVGSVGGIDLL